MLLRNNQVVDFDHRAYFNEAGSDSLLLSVSHEGNITIIDLENDGQSTLNFGKKISGISVSKTKRCLSIVEKETGNLVVLDLLGNPLHIEESIKFNPKSSETPHFKFLACHFDQFEKYFWCARLIRNYKIEVERRKLDFRTIIDKVEIDIIFGDEHYSFHPTNKADVLSLYIAAGQDGQEIYWLEVIDNVLIFKSESNFSNSTPPEFSPNGTKFLILDEDGAIGLYEYPTLKIGSCKWHLEENDFFAENIEFLSEDYALINSNQGRIFVLDVRKMKILDELIIENHEPLPEFHYYRNLKGDDLCTDLRYFEKVNEHIFFCFRQNGYLELKDWNDSFIVIPIKNILEEIKQ